MKKFLPILIAVGAALALTVALAGEKKSSKAKSDCSSCDKKDVKEAVAGAACDKKDVKEAVAGATCDKKDVKEAVAKAGDACDKKDVKEAVAKAGATCDKKDVKEAVAKAGDACEKGEACDKDKASKKLTQAVFEVSGMDCGACESKLTKALAKLDGVSETSACAKSKKAKLSYDSKKVKSEQILEAIEKTGYKVEAQLADLKVDGMACGACSKKVGKALTSLKGVKNQEVCHKSKKAKVAFDPKKVSEKDIVAAIDQTGFKVVQ